MAPLSLSGSNPLISGDDLTVLIGLLDPTLNAETTVAFVCQVMSYVILLCCCVAAALWSFDVLTLHWACESSSIGKAIF
jgi:hypothetical protein